MKKNSKDVVTYTEDEIRSDPYGFTLKEITVQFIFIYGYSSK